MRTKKKISKKENTASSVKGTGTYSVMQKKPPERRNTTEKSDVIEKTVNSKNSTPAANSHVQTMKTAEPIGIKKEPVKSSNLCKVTFTLPAEATLNARQVTIVGDFNNWDQGATPLKKLENGDFSVTLELDAGKEYRFRYLIDGKRWENDWGADKYVGSPYGVEDSVVCVHSQRRVGKIETDEAC